uniref:Uncharacterized protein n=1 Tax=Rhizophora mucronata TaxID=61149 RepID=A0A2P2NWP1_RHIMU
MPCQDSLIAMATPPGFRDILVMMRRGCSSSS